MKKSLVLAMAMALGVTASAYAANPFSDVPAGHWAYDSISKLAAAGVIEGYGDDTFRGDRLMTRYEMAQIVAKAMAKGANVDKLAAEFADELDALGVRVAALEKKADNVKITGQFRVHYSSYKDNGVKSHGGANLRSRLFFNGQINDNWKYTGMLQNNHKVGNGSGVADDTQEGTNFQRAFLTGRLGGLTVQAGRINKTILPDGDIYGNRMDAIDVTYGKQVKLNAYYGKPTGAGIAIDKKQAWGVNAAADLGKNVNLFAGYDVFGKSQDKDKIINAGLQFKLGKDVILRGTYLHTDWDHAPAGTSDDGFIIGAAYKGAKANKVGSWGLAAKYYKTPAGATVQQGWEDGHSIFKADGYKGFYVKGNVTLAKNIIADVEYWDLKSRANDNNKSKTLFSALYFTF